MQGRPDADESAATSSGCVPQRLDARAARPGPGVAGCRSGRRARAAQVPKRPDQCHHRERDRDRGDAEFPAWDVPPPVSQGGAQTPDAHSPCLPGVTIGRRAGDGSGWGLYGVVEDAGVLAPKRIGRRRKLLFGCTFLLVAFRRRRTDGDELLQWPDPLARKAHHVVAVARRCAPGVLRRPGVIRFPRPFSRGLQTFPRGAPGLYVSREG